jgi:hypothetical protein
MRTATATFEPPTENGRLCGKHFVNILQTSLPLRQGIDVVIEDF